jgi:GNAT superfamily N-acetyltransferase
VISVTTRSELNKFIKLPWKIYKGDKNWVPPLIKDMKEALAPGRGAKPLKGERELFLAFYDGKPAGRLLVGIDNVLNEKKHCRAGFISLFECIDNYEVAKALFDQAMAWFKEREIEIVRGPVSPTGADGDEYKGLLINSFDRPPVVMNSYNPEYYIDLFGKYGFVKDYDVYAYLLETEKIFSKDPAKVIEYAKKKSNFRIDTINFNNLEEEIKSIKHVLDLAIPDEWPDLVAPSLEEVKEIARKLIPIADPDIITIARSGDEAIGFGIAIPDYNQALIHLNGRITPLAALKFLWYKRKINCARFFIMFVIPSYRKKGVSHAIYYQTFLNAMKKGYFIGEGSTIGEPNIQMRKDIEGFGGQRYKTYRIFKMELLDMQSTE